MISPAHVHVPFDSREMADVITTLDRAPERVARIRRDNVVNALRRHDWADRWSSMLEWLGIAPTEHLTQRTHRLQELAALTEATDSAARREMPGWPPARDVVSQK